MSFDFYAEFWRNLNSDLKNWINKKWSDVRKNSRIHPRKKPEELRKKLEDDKNEFHEIISLFLKGNEKVSLTQYAKLQKISQIFVEGHMNVLKEHAHSVIQKDIRNYNRSKSPINKVDLAENQKEAYKMCVHPSKEEWFEIHKDIKEQIKWFDPMNNKQQHQILPRNSTLLKITFILKTPYISQDDEEFYIIDNPVCKDKVFKVPLVRASSWKGALRYAAIREAFKNFDELNDDEKVRRRLILFRLFGVEKDMVKEYLDELFKDLKKEFDEELRKYYGKRKDQEINVRGRLVFYPTFFNQIGLDVITPHDRKTKTPARGPIYFETAPEDATGIFALLYVPFDLIGGKEEIVKREIKEDLEILKEAIPAMLTKYGFGAKTTAGYGITENKVKFQILPEIKEKQVDENFGTEESKFEKEMQRLIGARLT